jgi:hypothetical protein
MIANPLIDESDESKKNQLSKQFIGYIDTYLTTFSQLSEKNIPEFEIRFGTKKIKNINKVDFYNIIKSLLNYDFKLNNENYYLKIMTNSSNQVRTQITGLPNIQSYCKLDNLSGIVDEHNLSFVQKDYFKKDQSQMGPLNFDDYNFRVSYQIEKNYSRNNPLIEEMYGQWNSIKKIFRYIKRYEYTHPSYPFLIHCSIVKTSKTNRGRLMEQFNIKDSDVFNSLENFEVEIELNNTIINANKSLYTKEFLYTNLRKVIKYILIGLQETNYPISVNEEENMLKDYLTLVKGADPNYKLNSSLNVNIRDFIGPSSNTLQMINILPESEINDTNRAIPNIRQNYTVTDKADGSRKLLYISHIGKMYFISTNMRIQFSGCISTRKELFNSIIDGEHILHDKKGNYVNTFACFDVYYFGGKNVTGLPFINLETKEKKEKQEKQEKQDQEKQDQEKQDQEKLDQEKEEKLDQEKQESVKKDYRLVLLKSMVASLDFKAITGVKTLPLKIIVKKFYGPHIFNGCATILNNINSGLYEYNTDGLIFTPANTGVNSKTINIKAPNYKTTWNESFKWKPPQFNTIDFLVRFKKNEFGENYIGSLNNDGTNLEHYSQVNSYYTLILNVGFDEKKHGYINPYNNILNNEIKRDLKEGYANNYKPCRFYPTNPSDINAGLCNILGKYDHSNNFKIYTEEGEEIEDATIVEFAYDSSKPELWRWQPLRVRSDKTSELRSGFKNFGNAYHTANANWQSIHNPISEAILTSGNGVTINNDDDVYYNKISKTSETQAFRDFHNLYVKNMLITNVSKSGYTLIDYAVGKGGDLPKWIGANLNFVLGLDISKDNIENRLDGVCARYLNYAQKFSVIPKALFLHANSSKNIKTGTAFYDEKSKQIMKALYGEGTKNETLLGKGVYNNFGIAKNGFNISSIQFALHYMFESESVLLEFINNLKHSTLLEGYFIGTCYDGQKIFNMLNSTNVDDALSIFKNSKKIWQITKKYDNPEFKDDETSLGYAIDIYQETINKTFREYLVNFKYFIHIMEKNGFVLLTETEYKQLNLPNSYGSFEQLYNFMTTDLKKNNHLLKKIGIANTLSDEEKQISFLNNYFVFKKIRNVHNNDDLLENSELLEKEEANNTMNEFDTLDKELEEKQAIKLKEKSKKLAEKYLLENQDLDTGLENRMEKSLPDVDSTVIPTPVNVKITTRVKLTTDEKIRIAEEKKKLKLEEKLKSQQEKKAMKEAEKTKKLEAKSKK